MMSWKVMFSRFCLRKSTRRSKWFASVNGITFLLARSADRRTAPLLRVGFESWFGRCRRAASRPPRHGLLGEHRLDLGLQRLGVERLDDVVVHARLLGGD